MGSNSHRSKGNRCTRSKKAMVAILVIIRNAHMLNMVKALLRKE